MNIHEVLVDFSYFLIVAAIFAPLFHLAGFGSALGFLTAGIIIGPTGLKLITNTTEITQIAKFGVVLLFFAIGIEIKPRRLWELRKELLGKGGLQVFLTTALLAIAIILFKVPWQVSIIIGFSLALSSTALILQKLKDTNQLHKPFGNTAFSILLFQDIIIIVAMAILPFLNPNNTETFTISWFPVIKSLGIVLSIIVLGHFLLRPIFRLIARLEERDIFTTVSLLLVVGMALIMEYAGLSYALGAFIAGVLIVDCEHKEHIEKVIDPFKGLLMGLFFMAIGMAINFELLKGLWGSIIMYTLILLIIKIGVIFSITRLLGSNSKDSLKLGILLWQGGEFGLILIGSAFEQNIIEIQTADLLFATISLSMVMTPIFIQLCKLAFPRLYAT